jgi:amidase
MTNPNQEDEQAPGIDRREFLRRGGLAGAALALGGAAAARAEAAAAVAAKPPQRRRATHGGFELDEATVADLQAAMQSGRHTSRSIVELYLARIAAVDKAGPAINSIIELNPDALAIADTADRARRTMGSAVGPLHGIPVLLKDNIGTADKMRTTAGSLALADHTAPEDADLVALLRQAGAVILGKTNLSEWANFRSTHSTSGWSGRGGQTKNPYALDRNPCGSSSGSGAAAAANLAALAVGSETDGSIVCPSATCGLVGIKPTLGLVSRKGIIPLAHSQDTAGPMARTVTDAAILLGVLSKPYPLDPSAPPAPSGGKIVTEFQPFLDASGLKGARVGVVRGYFGFNDRVDRIMEEAIRAMKDAGAVIVDPANLATSGKYDDSEMEVLLYDFKADLNAYFAQAGTGAAVKTLEELIQFNDAHKDQEMPFFGQELFLRAQAKGPLTSQAYKNALAKNHRMSRVEGIDATMGKYRLDALLAPTNGPAWTTDLLNGDHFTGGSSQPAAVSGYPSITVPAGFDRGLPVGISFFGRAWTEGILIRIAYAFEQATRARKKPEFLPTASV